MVYQYVVTLKNQNNRYIDILGLILSIFSVVCFTLELLRSSNVSVAYLIGSVAVPGIIAWNLFQTSKKRKVYYSRALLIAALVWMKMPYFQWLVFVFIILALLEYQAKYAIEIGFSDNEIVFNSLFKKRYHWKQFSNIVLRDGLLTLDFTNNRILQREVEDDEEDDADEDEFNEYCRKQLANVII
ncbi:hypothetical protein FAM09_26860 [Niastella caeni]|uniref:Uncharacterized protein n=1 Tax=Niastella caeni TaxID=2569763 RepID=A0A4V4GZE9_9BACT|nr:hypothetical protein [Niastella caeni]THU32416.1 hypothetical protein FAM09_26860 [Niastella caeni]